MRKADFPQLDALRAFESAARLGGFTRAAEELCVTHGAVSRRIAQLESALGVQLFERRNRGVFLSGDGSMLAEAVSAALRRIEEAIDRLGQPADQRPLVFSCERTLAMRWLIPRLTEFEKREQWVRLHMSTGGGRVDFDADRLDLAVRRDDFPMDRSWSVEELMIELVGPVCVPGLARDAERGTLPMIQTMTRPTAWAEWSRVAGRNPPSGDERWFDHFYLSLQAAASGLGAAIGPLFLVIDDIKAGRLVAPFGFLPDGSRYCAISRAPITEDRRKKVFVQWIKARAQATIADPEARAHDPTAAKGHARASGVARHARKEA